MPQNPIQRGMSLHKKRTQKTQTQKGVHNGKK